MSGSSAVRKALAVSTLLAATAFGASPALAQQGPQVPVSFHDAEAALAQSSAPQLNINVDEDAAQRFTIDPRERSDDRDLELELSAGGGNSPVDVSVAQRASLGGANGEVERQGRGSELRIGQGLVERREASNEPSVYMFVASEDEALTWQPGSRTEFGGRGSSLALQERVEVGDVSAGVTYERNGVQASLAYVERETSTRVGRHTHTVEHDFAGITVTMKR
jgi:hypothetical protein